MDHEINSVSNSSTHEKKMLNQNDDLTMTKKKLKVLKQALKDEKKSKDDAQIKYEQALSQIEQLKAQMAEKDLKYQKILQEKTNLEDSLLGNVQKQNSKNSFQNDPSDFLNVKQNSRTFIKPLLISQQTSSNSAISNQIKDQNNDNPFQNQQSKQIMNQIIVENEKQECNCKNEIELMSVQLKELEFQLKMEQDQNETASKEMKIQNELLKQDLERYEEEIQNLQQKIQMNFLEIQEKEMMILEERRQGKEDLVKQEEILVRQKDALKQQIVELNTEKNKLVDQNYMAEEKIDKLNNINKDLEIKLQHATDDINLRKLMIDQLNDNLLKHEAESMKMGQNLSLIKNQILEYDKYVGTNRKYGAVKIGTLKNIPITLEFKEQRGQKNEIIHYLIMDSKSVEISINCENIEEISECEDLRIKLVYYIPEEPSLFGIKDGTIRFTRKQDIIDCCENNLIIKTFNGIQNQIINNYGGEEKFKKRLQKLKQDFEANQDKSKYNQAKKNVTQKIQKLF